jgi:hypothetical protein
VHLDHAMSLDKLPRLAAVDLIASMIPTTLAGPFWEADALRTLATRSKVHKHP